MKRKTVITVMILALSAFSATAAHAWSSHCNLTHGVFKNDATLDRPVRVEPIEAFLAVEKKGIAALLESEEAWFTVNIPAYPALPAALRFDGTGRTNALAAGFSRALRINPGFSFPLYLQLPTGTRQAGRRAVPVRRVSR